ncbi:hypothetical protein BDZ45DRAFT_597847, partial [Acephala macrosclerotiorum]
PSNYIVYNTKKNFSSIEFRQNTKIIIIEIKEIFIKTYNNIEKVKKYYISLYRTYEIIYDELIEK